MKISVVKKSVKNGCDIETRNAIGMTPLHNCCREMRPDIIRYLISVGADVRVTDFDGNSPIMTLLELTSELKTNDESQLEKIFRKMYAILIALIDAGADVDCGNYRTNVTPLHLCCLHKKTDFVKLLVDEGADVNCIDIFGNTALHYAVAPFNEIVEFEDTISIVEFLLQNDANSSIKNTAGLFAVDIASQSLPEIVEILKPLKFETLPLGDIQICGDTERIDGNVMTIDERDKRRYPIHDFFYDIHDVRDGRLFRVFHKTLLDASLRENPFTRERWYVSNLYCTNLRRVKSSKKRRRKRRCHT